MDWKEFVKRIDELAIKYGWEKECRNSAVGSDAIETVLYLIKTGKTKSQFFFYQGNVKYTKYKVCGVVRGLNEYVGVKGNHVVSSCEEDINFNEYEEFDFELFEQWIKNQTELVARHDTNLKQKEINKNLKNAKKDFK
jgi:hypothetical protein